MAVRSSYYLATAAPRPETAWRPSVDVYRGEAGWLVKCDLAGVRPQDIETTIRGRKLTISGIRRDMHLVEGHRAYSLEITYLCPCQLTRNHFSNQDLQSVALLGAWWVVSAYFERSCGGGWFAPRRADQLIVWLLLVRRLAFPPRDEPLFGK